MLLSYTKATKFRQYGTSAAHDRKRFQQNKLDRYHAVIKSDFQSYVRYLLELSGP